MKRTHLHVVFLLLGSQLVMCCQSASSLQVTVPKITSSYHPTELSAQQSAVSVPFTAEAAHELQVDISGDETYTNASESSESNQLSTRHFASHQLSPTMKANLQKAKAAIETSQAAKNAGKITPKAARKLEKIALRSVLKASKHDENTLEIILAILVPPLAVYFHEDEINAKFWIDLGLIFLFWIPGVVYALMVVTDSI